MLTFEKLQSLVALARYWNVFNASNVIIAGGAPRDLLSGVPVKDIDVFIEIDPDDIGEGQETKFAKGCKAFATAIGGEVEFIAGDPAYGNIFDLANVECIPGHSIQLIGIHDDPIDDVMKYDFTLSQVFVTPKGVFMTPAAMEDRRDRIIRYTPSDDGLPAQIRSAKRYRRLLQKYDPNIWAYENCEILATMDVSE